MDPQPVSRTRVVLSHWMGITDANSTGNVHGGTVMKLADEAAGLAAIKHSRGRVVTVGMDRMDFRVPIHVGELVTFHATVNAAWRTSMEVGVRVEAENPFTGEARHTNTAYLTMVALDADGQPTPVPPLLAATPIERRRMREAELRRANRLAERAEIVAHRERCPTERAKSGLARPEKTCGHLEQIDYAYPVPTRESDHSLGLIQPWLMERRICSRGRFGAWRYELGNMHHAGKMGIDVARCLLGAGAEELWTG